MIQTRSIVLVLPNPSVTGIDSTHTSGSVDFPHDTLPLTPVMGGLCEMGEESKSFQKKICHFPIYLPLPLSPGY